MKIGDRIKRRRKELKLTADQLAELLGKNRATIYRYESSEIENMPIDIIEPLAQVLNVTPAYLMGWDEDNEKNLFVRESSSSYYYYPQSVSAGLPMHVDGVTDANEIDVPDSVMGKWAKDRDVFMMRINGESMNKTIPHGSLIAVKHFDLENLKEGDIVLYSHNNEYSVKRFYRTNGSAIFRPHSIDTGFTDNVIPSDDSNLTIHGKVVVYIVELD